MELLKDHNSTVRKNAIEILSQLVNIEAIKPIIELLRDSNWEVRQTAIEALGRLNNTKAVIPLLELLQDQDLDILQSVVEVLGKLGSVKAVKPLIKLLKDPEEIYINQTIIVNALGQLGSVEAVKPLLELLKYQDLDIHQDVTEALIQILGTVKTVKRLIKLIKSKDSNIRKGAVIALVELEESGVVELLLDLLEDKDLEVRLSAIETLGKLGNIEAIEPLLELLKNNHSKIRQNVAKALGQLGEAKSVKSLVELVKDNDSKVRTSAIIALAQLDNNDDKLLLIKLLKNNAIEPLIKLLTDRKSEVRSIVAILLGQIGNIKAVKPLISLLKDSVADVRFSAAIALSHLDNAEAIKPLIKLLKDENEDVQKIAVYALGKLGNDEAIKSLTKLLKTIEDETIKSKFSRLTDTRIDSVKIFHRGMSTTRAKPKHKAKDSHIYISAGINMVVGNSIFAEDQYFGTAEGIQIDTSENFLLNDNLDIPQNTINTFSNLESNEAIKPLTKLLKNEDSDIRLSAASALKKLGIKNKELSLLNIEELEYSFEELNELSESEESYERQNAAQNLSKIFSEQSVDLLISLTQDEKNEVKIQAIHSLGEIDEANLLYPALPTLYSLTENSNINIRRTTITTLGKIAPQLSDNTLLNKIASVAKNQQEIFPIRIIALRALAKLDKVTDIILEMVQPEESESFILAIIQALGNTRSELALDFLTDQLNELNKRKQIWREQKNSKNLNSWQYIQWETELGYAITQIAPKTNGIKMLSHNLAEVRKGAWLAIGRVGNMNIIKKLVKKYHESKSYQSYFRHAAYQAIDKALINVEVRGNEQDLEELEELKPTLEHDGIKDRFNWTISQMNYRIRKSN
ncbi:HEAT repeat domain-containing protein [Candidatus Halobeggiatoa sp. HSG11]|nr:HEAT repeat domain-containing protein [Candidatus Halobeggiatoa sp. HSG11]